MPRSLWNGTLALGMVRVAVKLYAATEQCAVRFHERHATDGAAIEHRRVCVQEDREVPYSEVVKGFEVAPGEYVALTKEEVAAADVRAAHVVEIEQFVGAQEIDPRHYDHPYYLGPGKGGDEAYRLLQTALARSERVGVGRLVFHNRAQLVALRALEEVLALHTMRFADELVPAGELDIELPRRPSERELRTARLLIDQLHGNFEPGEERDTYREALLALIERKARGETIETPPPARATAEDELLHALEASVEQVGAAGARARGPGGPTHPRGQGGRAGAAHRGAAARGASRRGAAGHPSQARERGADRARAPGRRRR